MTNMNTNINQILEFARNYSMPFTKKRAIIREYLQVKILEAFYAQKASLNFGFVGGTALRLLRNLDRFSEDLDFDAVNQNTKMLDEIIEQIVLRLTKENFNVNLYRNTTNNKFYFALRFPKLLQELKIGAQKEEKIEIKIDCENKWKGLNKEVVLLNRFGILFQVITISLDQIYVQKLNAFLTRKETQVRDIYDCVWLYAQGAKLDEKLVKVNKLPKDIINRAKNKFILEKKRLPRFRLKLKPFLINEQNTAKIDYFEKIS